MINCCLLVLDNGVSIREKTGRDSFLETSSLEINGSLSLGTNVIKGREEDKAVSEFVTESDIVVAFSAAVVANLCK